MENVVHGEKKYENTQAIYIKKEKKTGEFEQGE